MCVCLCVCVCQNIAGVFEDNLNSTGWGLLDIHTGSKYNDSVQHFGAGLVEGYLTANQIYPTYLNNLAFTFGSDPIPATVTDFFVVSYCRRLFKTKIV